MPQHGAFNRAWGNAFLNNATYAAEKQAKWVRYGRIHRVLPASVLIYPVASSSSSSIAPSSTFSGLSVSSSAHQPLHELIRATQTSAYADNYNRSERGECYNCPKMVPIIGQHGRPHFDNQGRPRIKRSRARRTMFFCSQCSNENAVVWLHSECHMEYHRNKHIPAINNMHIGDSSI